MRKHGTGLRVGKRALAHREYRKVETRARPGPILEPGADAILHLLLNLNKWKINTDRDRD
jgi:hypothetical protein